MSTSTKVTPEQRFTKENPCPACGGYQSLPSGQGVRCYGFLSDDATYAHCTREEHAGNLKMHPETNAFAHKLDGFCGCGMSHNGHGGDVISIASLNCPTVVYEIKDAEGSTVAFHERYDLAPGHKKFKWRRRRSGPRTLEGLPLADLPLYGSEMVKDWPEERTIVLVEGEKAKDALASRGLRALATVAGAKSTPGGKPLEVLRDRKVLIWPDNDPDGLDHMMRVVRKLKGVASSVTWYEWPEAPDKGDAADHPAVKDGDADALKELVEELRTAPEWADEAGKDETEGKHDQAGERGNQADRLIGYARDEADAFFVDQNGEPHALIDGEPMPLNSRCYGWLRRLMFEQEQRSCTSEALRAAAGTLAAFAEFSGQEIELHVRSAWHGHAVYYELGPGRVVKIDAKGYEILEGACPVLFRRYPNLKELPDPKPGGNLRALTSYVNLKTERDKRLYLAWHTTVPLPHVGRPIINTTGAMGSGKITLARLCKRVHDPTIPEFVRVGYRDFLQKAAHSYILALDNQSTLTDDAVDALCRLVTGEADSKRRLYTDDEDVIYQLRRAVVLNAINPPSDRPDFLDRSLMLELERIADTDRRDEEDLWDAFEDEHAKLLGVIFAALSKTLKKRAELKLSRKPRLADWGGYAAAAYEVMGFEDEVGDKKLAGAQLFLADWDGVVEVQNQATIEGSPVALAIIAFMRDKNEYAAIATTAYDVLKKAAHSIHIDTDKDKQWPKDPRWLWRKIKEVLPVLTAVGIEATRERTERGSEITLRKGRKNDASNASAEGNSIDKQKTPDDKEETAVRADAKNGSNVRADASRNPDNYAGSDKAGNTDNRFAVSSDDASPAVRYEGRPLSDDLGPGESAYLSDLKERREQHREEDSEWEGDY